MKAVQNETCLALQPHGAMKADVCLGFPNV